MIDENNGCITISKLAIIAKTLIYNNRSKVAAKQASKDTQ